MDVLRGIATVWMLAAHSHRIWEVPASFEWIKAPGNLAPTLFFAVVGMSAALGSSGGRLQAKAVKDQLRRAGVLLLVAGVGLHLLTDTSVPVALGVFDGIALSLLILALCISTTSPKLSCAITAAALYSLHIILGPHASVAALQNMGVTYGLALAILRQDAGFPVLSWAPFVLIGYLLACWLWLIGSHVVEQLLPSEKRLQLGALTGSALATSLAMWVALSAPDKWTTNPSYFALGIGWLALNTLVADQLVRMGWRSCIVILTTLGNWSLVLLGVNWFVFNSLPSMFGARHAESLALSITSMLVGVVSGIALAWAMQRGDTWIRRQGSLRRVLQWVAILCALAGILLLLATKRSNMWYLVGLGLSLLSPYALRSGARVVADDQRSSPSHT